MKISIITLFPEMFESVFASSIIKRANEDGKISINIVNLRNFGIGRHKTVDDKPYGGGVGMVLRIDVLEKAVESTKIGEGSEKVRTRADTRNLAFSSKLEKVVLLDPAGEKYEQKHAEEFSKIDHLILLCGHYEGFDYRIKEFIDMELTIGDYVLSGGEIPAMVVTESVARLVPGVLKKNDASVLESFSEIEGKRILEHPQYTRPEIYKGLEVPKVLLSGNFQEINKHRKNQSVERTKKNRPDII